MAYKINVSHNGKTLKVESDNEDLIGLEIGSALKGSLISTDLADYELTITGTSDKAGFPGIKDEKGPALKRVILTRGTGMWDKRDGVRLRKTIRGKEISADTVQINMIVKKEGAKKFESLIPVKEAKEVKK